VCPFQEFEPTLDMMMNDFDDERTMEEEEALEANEEEDRDELSALEQEQVRFIFSPSYPQTINMDGVN
jgi:hypothetical protein